MPTPHLLPLQPADAQALLRVALRLRPRAVLRGMHLQRGQELRYLIVCLVVGAAGCRIVQLRWHAYAAAGSSQPKAGTSATNRSVLPSFKACSAARYSACTAPSLAATCLLQVGQRPGEAKGGAVEEAAARLKGEEESVGGDQRPAPADSRVD